LFHVGISLAGLILVVVVWLGWFDWAGTKIDCRRPTGKVRIGVHSQAGILAIGPEND